MSCQSSKRANPKPSIGVVKAKMQQVKSKYGLQTVSIKKQKDGEVTIFVRHKKQDNNKRLLKIKLMSNAERMKMLTAAMVDLRKREEKIVDKKGTTEEAKAKDMLLGWTKAHPIIESAKVVDGKTTWDYLIDIGDKKNTEKGKGKTGVKGENNIDKDKMNDQGKKTLDMILKMEIPFTNKSKKKHKLDFELKGKSIVLFRKSIPKDIEEHIKAIKKAHKNEPDKETKKVTASALKIIEQAWESIEKTLENDLRPLFERTKIEPGKDPVKVPDNSFSIKKGKAVKVDLTTIAEALQKVPEIDKKGFFIADSLQVRPPSEDVVFKETTLTLSSGNGKSKDGVSMTANRLSRIGPSNTVGSQPNSAGYSELYNYLIANGRNVVAAHLLNHQLFGKGNNTENLTPIPSAKNSEMERVMEKPVKKAVLEENKVIYYKVEVNYKPKSVKDEDSTGSSIPEDKLIANSITATAHEWLPEDEISADQKGKSEYWTKKGPKIPTESITIEASDIKTKGTASATDLMDILLGKIDTLLFKKNQKLNGVRILLI